MRLVYIHCGYTGNLLVMTALGRFTQKVRSHRFPSDKVDSGMNPPPRTWALKGALFFAQRARILLLVLC
jgi:hypothetical protein